MKAMVIRRYGDADVFEPQDIEPPALGPDQALVRVHGSSVNPLDTSIRQGVLASFAPVAFPAVLGVDVSGELAEVGANVRRFAPGDRVYAYTGVGAGGGYGELAAVGGSASALLCVAAGLVGGARWVNIAALVGVTLISMARAEGRPLVGRG